MPIESDASDRFVSLKLLNANGARAAQLDRRPVLGAYPTTAWRAGEYISDTYELPIFVGAAPGDYTLNVTLYDPNSGNVHGQKDLERITLASDTHEHNAQTLDVAHSASLDFSGIQLVGYDLDTSEPYLPEDEIPLTLIWRVTNPDAAPEFDYELLDASGHVVHSHSSIVGNKNLVPNQYLRQETALAVPPNSPAGTYTARIAVRDPAVWETIFSTAAIDLGKIKVAVK